MYSAANLVPWGISFLSLLIAWLTFIRKGARDSKEDAMKEETKFDGIKESLLTANMKLDQVCTTTNETRSDIKALNKGLMEMDRRVTIVERDMKTLFNIIDDLKGRK